MELSEVVNDPDLAESFSILRSTVGTFVAGGWVNNIQTVPAYGVVTPATAKEMKMVPEGDEVHEAFMFYSVTPMYDTRTNPDNENADILVWNGENYRVIKVWNYMQRGFFSAMAVRMVGA